jgi:hypothetical protein
MATDKMRQKMISIITYISVRHQNSLDRERSELIVQENDNNNSEQNKVERPVPWNKQIADCRLQIADCYRLFP